MRKQKKILQILFNIKGINDKYTEDEFMSIMQDIILREGAKLENELMEYCVVPKKQMEHAKV